MIARLLIVAAVASGLAGCAQGLDVAADCAPGPFEQDPRSGYLVRLSPQSGGFRYIERRFSSLHLARSWADRCAPAAVDGHQQYSITRGRWAFDDALTPIAARQMLTDFPRSGPILEIRRIFVEELAGRSVRGLDGTFRWVAVD